MDQAAHAPASPAHVTADTAGQHTQRRPKGLPTHSPKVGVTGFSAAGAGERPVFLPGGPQTCVRVWAVCIQRPLRLCGHCLSRLDDAVGVQERGMREGSCVEGVFVITFVSQHSALLRGQRPRTPCVCDRHLTEALTALGSCSEPCCRTKQCRSCSCCQWTLPAVLGVSPGADSGHSLHWCALRK